MVAVPTLPARNVWVTGDTPVPPAEGSVPFALPISKRRPPSNEKCIATGNMETLPESGDTGAARCATTP